MSDYRAKQNSNPPNQYDLIVVGAGSGGFSAAITAAERGKNVLLVGYGTIGGTCVNVGCVPSKTLIRAVEIVHTASETKRFDGISSHANIVDWQAVIKQKQHLVDSLREVKYSNILPQYPNITYLEGKATLIKTGVTVEGKSYEASKTIIATGSSNAIPPIKGLQNIDYLDSTRLLEIKQLPNSLLVIGAGVIGCELAQTFSRAGVQVSVCCHSRLLPAEEPDISAALESCFQKEGIMIYKGIDYKEIKQNVDGYELSFNNINETVCAEKVLVCTGRKPNTNSLDCEAVGGQIKQEGWN